MLNQSLKFKVAGKEYDVLFPKVGQIIDMDIQKSILSAGQYGNLMAMGLETSVFALDKIDIQAALQVLCPSFFKDMKVSNIDELSIEDFNDLRKAYRDQFVPWYSDIIKLIKEGNK